VLLTKTGPRCISFRCKITVSLAQGAVNDAEADVADPVFVRSTIDDDRIDQRRTQNAYSNDARRRIVPMKKEMSPDNRHFSLHEQKAFGDVGRLPTSCVGIMRVRQVLPGHKCDTVIGSTCRRIPDSRM